MEKVIGSRIVIVGVSGSGKTRAAETLSSLLGFPLLELDSIHWLPGWQEAGREEMRCKVSEFVKQPTWVIDGNYNYLRDITWVHADTFLWLNYRLPLILWRLTKRTVRRVLKHEVLWGTNRETLRATILDKNSLYRWAISSYPKHQRNYPLALQEPQNAHLKVLRIKSPKQWDEFITKLIASHT